MKKHLTIFFFSALLIFLGASSAKATRSFLVSHRNYICSERTPLFAEENRNEHNVALKTDPVHAAKHHEATHARQNASSFSLQQNYPNPFNPVTLIAFELVSNEFVSLKVYDILGREVQTLVENKLSAGTHTAYFSGEKLPSGFYFYKLTAGGKQEIRKMMLMK